MVKRVNANLPDGVHRALRVKLAEEETNFSDWLRRQIDAYLAGKEPKGKRKGKEG